MEKKKVLKIFITIILVSVLLLGILWIKLLTSFISWDSFILMLEHRELMCAYNNLNIPIEDERDNMIRYDMEFHNVGGQEVLNIFIRNTDISDMTYVEKVISVTNDYILQYSNDDFNQGVRIFFESVGSCPAHGSVMNYNVFSNELLFEGQGWMVQDCNILADNCTELYEKYAVFAGFWDVYIEDVSDYEVLANWEGLECLTINCGNNPEEIELYNEALREMFPERYVSIRAR